jgi:osmoprotectant transport system substrate-binding protein
LTSPSSRQLASAAFATFAGLAVAACGSNGTTTRAATSAPSTTTTALNVTLPGTGKPRVTIGDKNYTEQFMLGELYRQALVAQGFTVSLNRNIGPTAVSVQAVESGRLDLYPEDLQTWNTAVAGDRAGYPGPHAAYEAALRYARKQGLTLLNPTPFGYTDAIAVTAAYAQQNDLHSIADLAKVAGKWTLGAPPQFKQRPGGLTGIESAYSVMPAAFMPLQLGDQYQALDQGTIQAADVNTTDGQLDAGIYTLLADPKNVFGWGNVVPVVAPKTLDAEGPVFAQTINRVSALLSPPVMRQLDAQVDVAHQEPAAVARRFLLDTGLVMPQGPS